jgi:hypothetical protein
MDQYETGEDRADVAALLPADPPEDPLRPPPAPVAPPPLLAPPLAIHCGLCGSPHVLIVGLAWNMDHHTGDAHYGYEVLCEECHRFSASAHIEQATECDALWAQARATQATRRATRQTLLARITARLTLRDIH